MNRATVPKTVALIPLVAVLIAFGCDDGSGFGPGLDDGSQAQGSCEAEGEYPAGPHSWDLHATAPPSRFDGSPRDLDLQSIYCQRETIRSLVFVLGAYG